MIINRKTIIITLLFVFVITGSSKEISGAKVKSLNGQMVDTKTFADGKRPVLVLFFGICCSTSLNALEDLHESSEELIENHNLKIILVSLDDSRNSRKVVPLLKGKGYDYEVYFDENGDFRRAMGVHFRPHYILFDSTGNSIYEKSGYMPGISEALDNALE